MHASVTTSSGKLRGRSDAGIQLFAGIPFARPPLGALRWRAPEPVEPWADERDASEFGASAPQLPLAGGMGDLIGIPSQTRSEDCLTLNVWTPEADGARRPVMVWIHGGGNTVGSGTQPRIDGQHLARHGDVVVVTLNYRLGSLGFLHSPELGASGNEGLLDQLAALRWVRREIANFGGDPGNVTVFGQSAGGFDIAQLMGLPAAAGAFDKAVPMSGSLTPQVPADRAAATAARFAERFGGFDALRSAPADELIAFQQEITSGGTGPRARFGPVLDGAVIQRDAAVGVASGAHTRGMPLMIGCTRDEFALFTVSNEALAGLDDDGLLRMVRGLRGDRARATIDGYREARTARGESSEPLAIWNALMTDQMFRIPAIRTAELHSAHTPQTFMYVFDHASPALEGRLGSCHSLDIPFIWGTYGADNMRGFCGSGATVEALSSVMMDLYVAFARNGDPATDALPDWPRYDTARRATMHLGEKCHVEDAPCEPERAIWDELAS